MATGIPVVVHLLTIIVVFLPAIVTAQETNQYAGTRLTSGRLMSLTILTIGMIGLIIGYKTGKRPVEAPADNTKRRAVTALVLGLLCIGFFTIHLVNSTDFGTGGGKAASIAAMVVGGTAVALAVKAFYRLQKIKTR